MNIAILILAAGGSSRMKATKQLLPIDNNTMLGLTIERALNSKANKVFCVLGAHSEDISKSIADYNVKIILNSEFEKGLSSSIIKGIESIKPYSFNAVLITLADQPNVDIEYINTLIDTSKKHSQHIIASNYSGNYGVPAIFPSKFFDQLLQLKGDKGAKIFLNSNSETVIAVEAKDQLIDIDTREDYLNYLKNT